MSDHEALGKALTEAMGKYLDGHRKRSLSGLAKKAHVGYTTVRRLAQGECLPHPETTLNIIDVIMETPDKVDFLKTYMPRIGRIMEESYPKDIRKEPNHELLRRYRSLETHNFVFNLAATKSGTTVSDVERLAGERGLVALDEMVEHEILVRDPDGHVKFTSDTWSLTSPEEVLQQIHHSVAYFDKDLIGSKAAKLMHATASLNRDAVHEIHALAEEFIGKVMRIKHAPEAEGEIPFYLDLVMNLYDKSRFTEDGEP